MILNKVLFFIGSVVGVVSLVYSGLYFFQYKLLFYPTELAPDYIFKFKYDVPFEEKTISYGDKESIHALLFQPANPVGRIMYFHGNGGALDSWGYVGEELAIKYNSDVLILDYPGYGKSTAGVATSDEAIFNSADAAFEIFKSSTEAKLPIVLIGRSLGSGVASYLAAKNNVQGLILETPYISIKKMARIYVPIVPEFIVKYELDNLKALQNLQIPVLMIHGTQDEVIPYNQAAILHKKYPKVNFVTVENGDHNNLSGYPVYWEAMDRFFALVQN